MVKTNTISSNTALLIRESGITTPYVQIRKSGVVVIRGISTMIDARKFYMSIFWAINKIRSTKFTIEIDLAKINAASIRHIYLLLSIISRQSNAMDISVFWIYKENDNENYEQGKLFEELLPSIKFSYFSK